MLLEVRALGGGPEDFVGLKEPSPRISYLHPAPETDRETQRQRDGETERDRETERETEGVSESRTRERLTRVTHLHAQLHAHLHGHLHAAPPQSHRQRASVSGLQSLPIQGHAKDRLLKRQWSEGVQRLCTVSVWRQSSEECGLVKSRRWSCQVTCVQAVRSRVSTLRQQHVCVSSV